VIEVELDWTPTWTYSRRNQDPDFLRNLKATSCIYAIFDDFPSDALVYLGMVGESRRGSKGVRYGQPLRAELVRRLGPLPESWPPEPADWLAPPRRDPGDVRRRLITRFIHFGPFVKAAHVEVRPRFGLPSGPKRQRLSERLLRDLEAWLIYAYKPVVNIAHKRAYHGRPFTLLHEGDRLPFGGEDGVEDVKKTRSDLGRRHQRHRA
jgi:hypothetical protein